MTSQNPHQQRCETCGFNKYTEGKYIYCEKSEELLVSKNAQEIISIVGCASHSNQQSVRDKVLDDVLNKLCEYVNIENTDEFDNISIFGVSKEQHSKIRAGAFYDMAKKIEELRQKAGERG